MGATIVIMLEIVIARSFLIAKGSTGLLNRMTLAMKVLAEGNSDVEISASDYGNELGQMSTAVLIFKDNIVQNQKMVKAEEKSRMASEFQVNKRNQLT